MLRILFLFLVISISGQAAEIMRDRHGDKIYLFEADTSEIPATVDQTEATLKATDWAIRFYDDFFLLASESEFRTKPTRFWLITFSRSDNQEKVYAVVLPNGAIVQPKILTQS